MFNFSFNAGEVCCFGGDLAHRKCLRGTCGPDCLGEVPGNLADLAQKKQPTEE